ncbi:MAG TPA: DUF6010 family protein [Chitinophagales bacterium]|nr:DUF6010 family protein [Chitinophagales bacterium]
MVTHTVPEFTLMNALAAVLIAFVYILLSSFFLKEPNRQRVNAIILAGAGAVYWSGGLGVWEFMFGSAMLFVAFKGLTYYYFIGIGWLMHTSWDIVHHLYANPIVYLSPSSSAGCAVCDVVLAIWFFYKAPSVFDWFRKAEII